MAAPDGLSASAQPERGPADKHLEEQHTACQKPQAVGISPVPPNLPPFPGAPGGSEASAEAGSVAAPRTPRAAPLGLLPALFVLAFAALLASFPARNSDLLGHLAAGRDVASGHLPSGAAPDAPADSRIHQPWLYNLACYGVYTLLGGTGLLLVKVLLVVGLAWLLLRLSRAGPGWGIAAACTALALLAMGLRLLLQPATVSYFFLALTLWLVREEEAAPPGSDVPAAPLPPWRLWLLFVLWVNVDGWFVVGLGVVALVWLGRVLDGAAASRAETLGRRAVAFALLAAGCLLNPSHVHAFVPADWASLPQSPFHGAYFASGGLRPASLAYFPLLALALLSFVLNLPRWRWERFLPWLALAALSALQVKAVPFFAVVAGPVLAWNVYDKIGSIRRRSAARQPSGLSDLPAESRPWVVGCGLTAGVALLVCAWPGWLQAPPFEPRRWGVELPPSLERAAAAVRGWHQEGKLTPARRGLHLAPETAHAFAWFCPEENGLKDEQLAAAVLGLPEAPRDWPRRFREAGVDHVIVYAADRERLLAALHRLLRAPQEWPLLYLEGDLAVFGWRDPAAAGASDRFRGWELDLNRLAFRPGADKVAPRTVPEEEPGPRRWWDAFWKAAPPHPIDRNEAALYLLYAEALAPQAPHRRLAAWEAAQTAALAGAGGGWPAPTCLAAGALIDADLRLALLRPPLPEAKAAGGKSGDPKALPPLTRLAFACQQWFALEQDDVPPALLYLAVRAARRALAANPEDAQANLVLGECYWRLLNATRERAWARRAPQLGQLRLSQASAALNRAVALRPNLAAAHSRLVTLYRELGYLDLALHHRRAYRKLTEEAGPDSAEEKRLADAVAAGEAAYAAETSRMGVLDRALVALKRGLAGKARDLLLESDVAAFGPQGMALELELLLRTGQAKKVREWTTPEHRTALGPTSYHWLRAQAFAASGDYARAEEECEELASEGRAGESSNPRGMMAGMIGRAILDEQPVGAAWFDLPRRGLGRPKLQARLLIAAKGLRQDANANVFRGLLALERGDVDEAEVAFRLALAVWRDEAAAASGGGLEFNARPIARECLRWLGDAGKGR